jgi:hypothetical protein
VSALVARLTDQPNLFVGKVLRHLPGQDATEIEWQGLPLLAPHTPAFAAGDAICWVVPAEGVVLVREDQQARENTVLARVAESLAWRGHASITAHVGGRRDAALSFAIGASVAARRGIVSGAEVPLQLQKSAIRLLPPDPAVIEQIHALSEPTT